MGICSDLIFDEICIHVICAISYTATENEAACMIQFLKVLDQLSAQEFVVSPDDDVEAGPNSPSSPASPTALTTLLQDVNICEVVCVGKYLLCIRYM